MMMQGGTSKHTAQELMDSLGKLKSRVMILPSGTGGIKASIDTDRANLSATLAIAAEMLRDPAFPQPSFEQFKRQFETVFKLSSVCRNLRPVTSSRVTSSRIQKSDVRYTASWGGGERAC